MKAGVDLQTEFKQVKFTMNKLQEDKDIEIIELKHIR